MAELHSSAADFTDDPTPGEPPTRPPVARAAWVQLAVCTAVAALLQIDGTVVTVALPSVGDSLDVSAQTASWGLTSYFAVYAVGLFPGGRLVDRFGPRRVALAGLLVFCVGTLLGALADSFTVLLASRLLQGAGAGLASPAALAGAVSGFPAERRGTALGIWGAASGLANLVGPLLGGILTEAGGWRANWWALLPMGLLAAGAVGAKVRAAETLDETSGQKPSAAADGSQPAQRAPARASGASATASGVSAGMPGSSDMPSATASGASAGAPGAVGVPSAVMSLRMVHSASAVAALTFALMIGTFFAVEQYLQHAAGYGVLAAAVAPMVLALCIGAAGPVAGRLTDRHGERAPALIGFGACAVAFAAYVPSALPLHGWPLLPGGLVLGFGLGLLFPATSRAALNSVPRTLHGRASALLSFGRLAGAACGAGLAGLAFRTGVSADHLHTALLGGVGVAATGALLVAARFRGSPGS